MRKIITFCLFMLVLAQAAMAQDTIKLKNISGTQKVIVTDRPPQAVYFQLGGSGPIASVNYDRRFGKRLNGLGFSAGLGFWVFNDLFVDEKITMVSVPVSINYLIGRKTHFVELAAGTTFVSARVSDFFDDPETGSGFIHHVNLGYRHQPATGGFFFRGGVSPMFAGSEYFTSFYLGFGYNF